MPCLGLCQLLDRNLSTLLLELGHHPSLAEWGQDGLAPGLFAQEHDNFFCFDTVNKCVLIVLKVLCVWTYGLRVCLNNVSILSFTNRKPPCPCQVRGFPLHKWRPKGGSNTSVNYQKLFNRMFRARRWKWQRTATCRGLQGWQLPRRNLSAARKLLRSRRT